MAVGIVGYGGYVPRYRIKVEDIARTWGEEAQRIKDGLGIFEKSVPDLDEDAATMAVESARNAIAHAGINPQTLGAVFVGSESHPYAVKPTATIVAEALGATPNLTAADLEFACKAGTTAIQCCMGMVSSGMIEHGLAIGSDTSQGRPGDALEYTASAGAGSFIIGKDNLVAEILGTYSYTTDTPDFWRRPSADFPSHGGRFTGEPAYFKHVVNATKGLMEKMKIGPKDPDYVVFHQPNGKFPREAAKILGIDAKKLEPGLLTPRIGNTYSGASMLGLAATLDVAKPGQHILVTSFGSGAGSDSFLIKVTDAIEAKRPRSVMLSTYIDKREYLDYGLYVKFRKKLKSL
ncbi:Hydroxymethylglutaryl-CoA synthase [Candidatus Burarchaeum australiense]|nr:Hydroxymethylglutaryl-CoA synthase [Candidatus Burarchaeum australiense]